MCVCWVHTAEREDLEGEQVVARRWAARSHAARGSGGEHHSTTGSRKRRTGPEMHARRRLQMINVRDGEMLCRQSVDSERRLWSSACSEISPPQKFSA